MKTEDKILAPAELADVWRNPDDPRWDQAWKAVQRVFSDAARKHPLVAQARKEDRNERILELAHSFWIYLTENPTTLEAKRVRGEGALFTEALRFLDKQPADGVSDQRRVLRKHLRDKVRAVLKKDPHFEPVGRLWGLSAAERIPAVAAKSRMGGVSALPDSELAKILPDLISNLKPQRSGQLPPLVGQSDLPGFLAEALRLSQRPRSDWDLSHLVWECLVPAPDAVLGLATVSTEIGGSSSIDIEDKEPSPEFRTIQHEWEIQIDVLASQFLEELPARTGRVAVLWYQQQTLEEIAEEIGVSQSTAGNERQTFDERFSGLVTKENLDRFRAEQLHRVILDNLEVEGF